MRFCLIALGAQLTSASKFPANADEYDLIVVENRDKSVSVPDAMVASGKLANVVWLKACLLSGFMPTPALLTELKGPPESQS